jgi:hypothetical protein
LFDSSRSWRRVVTRMRNVSKGRRRRASSLPVDVPVVTSDWVTTRGWGGACHYGRLLAMPDLGPDTGAWHGRGQRYELGGVARWVLELVDGADDRQERISGRTSSASIAPVGGQHPHIAAGPVSRRVTARGALSPCREARAPSRDLLRSVPTSASGSRSRASLQTGSLLLRPVDRATLAALTRPSRGSSSGPRSTRLGFTTSGTGVRACCCSTAPLTGRAWSCLVVARPTS